jgi:hypothetical protein
MIHPFIICNHNKLFSRGPLNNRILPIIASNKNHQSCSISRFLSQWKPTKTKTVKRQTVIRFTPTAAILMKIPWR